jgi:uncharacterized protein DUF4390
MRASLPAVAFCLISGLTAVPAIGGPVLTHLAAHSVGDAYEASCRLEGGLTPDVEEEIAAGLATTIEYRLHVYRRRPAFFDQLILKRRVQCTVRYDTLTQQYTLTRRIDDDMQETKVTDDPAAMREFMTSLKAVPLVKTGTLKPGEEYYLKAKSNLGLVWRFYVIPWPMDTDWERVPIGPEGAKILATQP